MKGSFLFKSHPDKLLIEHLMNCAEYCKKSIMNIDFVEDGFIRKDDLRDIMYIIGYCHDLGKATSYFQKYLLEADQKLKQKMKNNPRSHHGLLSSIITFYFIKSYCDNNFLQDSKYKTLLPYMAFLAVLRHHGNPENIEDEINILIDYCEEGSHKDIIIDQIISFNSKELLEIIEELKNSLNLSFLSVDLLFDEPLIYIQKNIIEKSGRVIREIKRRDDISVFILQQIIYSILLQADKYDVILKGDLNENSRHLEFAEILNYKKEKFNDQSKQINKIREKIFDTAIAKIDEVFNESCVLSINVPTGLGKTITALGCAYKLRDKINNKFSYHPRIIYALPFLSIIEQNYKVMVDIFRTENPSIILKHHHLSEIKYSKLENVNSREFETNESEFLIEGWESETIVTTFMQFFHSIMTNNNRMVRKFHKIINSIILLDEVQSIPHKYWLVLNRLIKELATRWKTYFLLITATQPLIFSHENNEIVELIENKTDYYKNMDRVSIQNKTKEETQLSDFCNIILNDLNRFDNESFLIILNTIKSSKIVYEFIDNHFKKNSCSLYYLSTRITPFERISRIEDIRKNKNCKKIIVSTQLIEAGVDISVDRVYRDFAPVDCIIQSAGRCNRNNDLEGNGKKGNVIIYRIKDERKVLSEYIYDPFLLDKTHCVLKGKDHIEESGLNALIKDYYDKVKRFGSENLSRELIKDLHSLNYENIKTNFKLIDDKNYNVIDVFIELNDEAESLWNEYSKIKDIANTFERRLEFLKIKSGLYKYIITVPREHSPPSYNENSDLCIVDKIRIKEYYSYKTGYIIKDEPSSLIF